MKSSSATLGRATATAPPNRRTTSPSGLPGADRAASIQATMKRQGTRSRRRASACPTVAAAARPATRPGYARAPASVSATAEEGAVRVAEIMQTDLLCCPPETGVADAAAAMTRRSVGACLVVSGGLLRGIFTERDLL